MTKRLMRSMIITVVIIFILGALITTVSFCSFEAKKYKDTLFADAEYIGHGVLVFGTEYLDGLDNGDKHVVWLDAEGQVLYDSLGSLASDENYFVRDEVTWALEDGKGSQNYGVDAFSGVTVSSAVKLDDGSILIVSSMADTFMQVLKGIGGSLSTTLIIYIIITGVASTLISRSLISKLNNLKSDGSNDTDLAEELKPMLERLTGKVVPEDRKDI